MKKTIAFFFDKWWRPILFFVFTVTLFIASEFLNSRNFSNISFALFGLGWICLLISAIYQLVNRNWIRSILTFLLFGGTIAAVLFYWLAMFFIEQETPDPFTNNLIIPTNIPIHNPLDLGFDYHRPDSMLYIKMAKTEFHLYNSFQPGLYEYDFWTGRIENGKIYLKAFEITHSFPLSSERLPERTTILVSNLTDSIVRFSTFSHFTIYEGDWGHPYAARFEVWFQPENEGAERKLFEKNYKIEGWMR